MDRYTVALAAGYVELRRHWDGGARRPLLSRRSATRVRASAAALARERTSADGQSARSRNRVQKLLLSLPLEMLGDRGAMVTLTYPRLWRSWLPDGETLAKHRDRFADEWRRKFGEPPIGLWFIEFQRSGRPHLHLYVRLPSAMTDAEFEGLRERTKLGKRLERAYGRYEGRRRTPPIGMKYGGQFAVDLRTLWAEAVGTQGVDRAHHVRGVDVRVMFFSDEAAATVSRARVAAYLADEAAKKSQKTPPAGFRVSHYYGVWGRKHGFKPVLHPVDVSPEVAVEVERRIERWVRLRSISERRQLPGWLLKRRPGDGICARRMTFAQGLRLIAYAERAVARQSPAVRQHRHAAWRARRYDELQRRVTQDRGDGGPAVEEA